MLKSCNAISREVGGPPAERVRQFEAIARAGVPGIKWIALGVARSRGTAAEVVQGLLDFCHGLPRVPDPEGRVDWVRDPCAVATLGGDCDDLAVLLMALCLGAGISARIRWLPMPGQREDHVCCEVFFGGGWHWAEPLLAGARVGEHPADASRRLSSPLVRG